MVILIAKACTTIKACTTNSIEATEYCLFTIHGYGVPFLFSIQSYKYIPRPIVK